MGKDLRGKELGEGLSQRSDKYYVARFTNRRGNREQKVSKNLKECRKWLADREHADENGEEYYQRKVLVSDWYNYWIGIKEKTVRPNTVRNYKMQYKLNIEPVISKMYLDQIKPIHCQKIMNNMVDKNYKSSSIHQVKIALHNMLDFAVQNEVIPKNPCTKIVKTNIGRPSESKRALTIVQQRAFVDSIKGYAYEYQYRFILQTGLRTGELIGLKWSDVDFENRTLTVSRTMDYKYSSKAWRIGEPKSKSGYRTIPLTEEAIKILELQKEKNSRIKVVKREWLESVFLYRDGTPVKNTAYDTGLYKRCSIAEIPQISMHILRHTFATRCIEAGMKPKTLQMILGHSKIGVTMDLYVHTTDEEKRREIDEIAEKLMVI